MAWIVSRSHASKFLRVVGYSGAKTTPKQLCKPNELYGFQTSTISGKALRDKSFTRPAPFPYKEKTYSFLRALFDPTPARFDENSKLVVVEGPIAAGKTEFAKSLAEDLDMLHMPEVNMDMLYINEYGYDLRQLDPRLPENCKSFDVKNFYKTPNHVNTATFQIRMYMLRYSQYIDALVHILNTGQGVVLERCAYSDAIFAEAMMKFGYISKGAFSVYQELRQNTITEVLRPHLVIYLDVPINVIQERIKKRNLPYEAGSKVLSVDYLKTIEELYKRTYLKEISNHAELLIYDWSQYGDVEVVVEDIERIDFDRFEKHDPKLHDWRLADKWEWNNLRMEYTNDKTKFMSYFNIPRYDVPELIMTGDELETFREVWLNAPGNKYVYGYNADMGDQNILFKTKLPPTGTGI